MTTHLRPLAVVLSALGLAVAQLVALAAVTGPTAAACSCAEFTLDSALAEGDAAFVGTAVDRNEGDDSGFDMAVRWSFEVSSVVKGELPATLEVWSGRDDGDCGVVFEFGEPVGVVLRRNGDRYTTNICGGVWLPDELRTPGALAAPTGSGPVALVATGRTGDAIIASYDAGGNLAAWGLGGADDELSHLRVCPGSKVLVGMTVDRQGTTRVVRRDVATLSVLGSATLPARPPDSWPHLTDNRGFRCTSPDGDVAFLVSASGYGNGPADNVVVWVDGETTTMHPVEDAFAFAVAPDLSSAYLVTGDGGTMVEVITLADGTRRPFAELPDRVGGRVLGVDHATGRLAVIATSNPAATNRGDPAAPDDHLVVVRRSGRPPDQRGAEPAGPRRPRRLARRRPPHRRVLAPDHARRGHRARRHRPLLLPAGRRRALGSPQRRPPVPRHARRHRLDSARRQRPTAAPARASPECATSSPSTTDRSPRHNQPPPCRPQPPLRPHRRTRCRPPKRQPAWRPPRTNPTSRHQRRPTTTTAPAAPRDRALIVAAAVIVALTCAALAYTKRRNAAAAQD